jgi:glycosyltransferase involved in cell wall biosynthesis
MTAESADTPTSTDTKAKDLTTAGAVGICMVTTRLGQIGGSESYAKGLLAAYCRLAPYRIRLLANDDLARAYSHLEGGSVSIHALESFRLHDSAIGRASALARAAVLPRQLRREVPPDLAAVHYPVAVSLPRLPMPRIVTLHDMQHHDMPENFSRAQRIYRAIAYDASARYADQVITVSEYSRTRIIQTLGVPPERVHAIHHGLDHERFQPRNLDLDQGTLDTLDVPGRYVFYPANLWPHKNHQRLIAAFARIDDSRVHLVLTGQRYEAGKALEDTVRLHRVTERVHHLGYVSPDLLPALYRRAVGLIFPSQYEGFGAPPLEAMACGCAVATSNIGALDEVCGGAALTFAPDDERSITSAINNLVEDQDLRDQLRADGFARAAQFTWHHSADEHLRVYQLAVHRNSA